jgi:hypothetical protein
MTGSIDGSRPVPLPTHVGARCGIVDWTAALPLPQRAPERDRHPDFFVIGATKAGTTSLNAYLTQHPQVFMPAFKELGFFQIDDEYAQGFGYLARRHYAQAERFAARGDATPTYLYNEFVAERIQRTLPPASHRFIVLLRDPVRRAYSAYLHMVRLRLERETFEDALALEDRRVRGDVHRSYSHAYLTAGRYDHFLGPWYERFGASAFLPMVSEELRDDPTGTLRKIAAFLQIDRDFDFDTAARLNAAGDVRFGILPALWRAPEPVKRVLNRAIPYRVRGRLQEVVAGWDTKAAEYQEMDPHTARRLREFFAPDVARLERRIGRTLEKWSDIR